MECKMNKAKLDLDCVVYCVSSIRYVQSKAFYVRNTMVLDSFLRGLHSNRKLDLSDILFTSIRRDRVLN